MPKDQLARDQLRVARPASPARRRVTAVVGALFLSLVATACSAPNSAPSDGARLDAEVVLATSNTASMTAMPVASALALDTFADVGLNVTELGPIGSSPNTLAALLSGDADFAYLGGSNVIDAQNEGAEIVILSVTAMGSNTLGLRTELFDEIGLSTDDPIEERMDALAKYPGLTIATAQPGTSTNNQLSVIMRQYGVDPSQFNIVPSEPTAMIAGLQQGLYDGVWWPVGVMEVNFANKSAKPYIQLANGDVPGAAESMVAVTITTRALADSQPGLVEAFIKGMTAGAGALAEPTSGAFDAIKERVFKDTAPEVYELMWESAKGAWSPEGGISEKLFDIHLQKQAADTGKDYSGLTFEESVYPAARR